MAIENRDLKDGTKLFARYKGETHTVLVLADHQGKPGFELDGGTIYHSLSMAGSAVMGGTACNGWRFWTPEGDFSAKPAREPKKAKAAKGKTVRQLRRLPNQKGVADGQVKWFCSACMKSFIVDGNADPAACLAGHTAEAVDDLAPPES